MASSVPLLRAAIRLGAGLCLVLTLGACGPAGPWSWERALAPTLVRLDTDGDGLVGYSEYMATVWQAPPFAIVDGDLDGSLEPAELQLLILSQDPVSFDGAGERKSVRETLSPEAFHPDPYPVRILAELFSFMAEEVRQRDAAALLPSQTEIDQAAQTGSPDSPESQAILAHLGAAWAQHGLAFPARLLPQPPTPSSP